MDSLKKLAKAVGARLSLPSQGAHASKHPVLQKSTWQGPVERCPFRKDCSWIAGSLALVVCLWRQQMNSVRLRAALCTAFSATLECGCLPFHTLQQPCQAFGPLST